MYRINLCALSCPFSGPFSRHSSPLFLSRSLSDSAFPRKKAVRKHLMTATVPSETRSGPVLSGPAPEAPAFFGDYRQNRAHPWTQSCPLSARHNLSLIHIFIQRIQNQRIVIDNRNIQLFHFLLPPKIVCLCWTTCQKIGSCYSTTLTSNPSPSSI